MGNVIVEMGKFFLRKYPEIVADATNSLALHIADMRRKEQLPAAKPTVTVPGVKLPPNR